MDDMRTTSASEPGVSLSMEATPPPPPPPRCAWPWPRLPWCFLGPVPAARRVGNGSKGSSGLSLSGLSLEVRAGDACREEGRECGRDEGMNSGARPEREEKLEVVWYDGWCRESEDLWADWGRFVVAV